MSHHRRSTKKKKKKKGRHHGHGKSDDHESQLEEIDWELRDTDLLLVRGMFKNADQRGVGRLRKHEFEDALKALLVHENPVKYGSRAENSNGGTDQEQPVPASVSDTAIREAAGELAPSDTSLLASAEGAAASKGKNNSNGGRAESSNSNPALESALEEVMRHRAVRALLFAPPAQLKRQSVRRMQPQAEPDSADTFVPGKCRRNIHVIFVVLR